MSAAVRRSVQGARAAAMLGPESIARAKIELGAPRPGCGYSSTDSHAACLIWQIAAERCGTRIACRTTRRQSAVREPFGDVEE